MTIRDQDYGCVVTTNAANTITGTYYYDESSPNMDDWRYIRGSSVTRIIEKGGEDMRYLYEVILINPEDENFEIFEIVAKNEVSALIQAYEISDFNGNEEMDLDKVDFDDLKTKCRVLMEWKKEGE